MKAIKKTYCFFDELSLKTACKASALLAVGVYSLSSYSAPAKSGGSYKGSGDGFKPLNETESNLGYNPDNILATNTDGIKTLTKDGTSVFSYAIGAICFAIGSVLIFQGVLKLRKTPQEEHEPRKKAMVLIGVGTMMCLIGLVIVTLMTIFARSVTK